MTPEDDVASRSESAQAEPASGHRRRGLWLLAASLLLVGLGAVAEAGLVDLVLIRRVLDHPVVLGVAAVCLFGAALCHFTTRGWLRFLVGFATACAAVTEAALSWYLFANDPVLLSTSVAPGRSDVRAIVEVSDGVVDQVWTVSVRQNRGLLSREWEVGSTCYTSPRVRWEGPSRLVVETSSGSEVIAVDPDTGQPENREGAIWAC